MAPIAPWAIFGTVYNASEGMVPLVYLVGLIAMIFTALAYAQMAKEFPLAGSVYAYVGRGLHRVVGLFAGWSILLDYLLVPTLLFVFGAESMVGIFPGTERWMWAIVFVVINTVVNLIGIRSLARFNRVFLAIELVFLAIFVVIRGHRAGPGHHQAQPELPAALVVPLIGLGIIGYVLTQADTNAKVGGVVWLAVGALVFLYFLLTGRSRELTIGEGA